MEKSSVCGKGSGRWVMWCWWRVVASFCIEEEKKKNRI
jgi:hypothetical protein